MWAREFLKVYMVTVPPPLKSELAALARETKEGRYYNYHAPFERAKQARPICMLERLTDPHSVIGMAALLLTGPCEQNY